VLQDMEVGSTWNFWDSWQNCTMLNMTLSWIFSCHFWWLWKRNWSHLVFCNLSNLYERWVASSYFCLLCLHLLAVHPDVVLVVAITEVLWESVSLSTSWCVLNLILRKNLQLWCYEHTCNLVSLLTWNKMRNWSCKFMMASAIQTCKVWELQPRWITRHWAPKRIHVNPSLQIKSMDTLMFAFNYFLVYWS
jgi:hypothetical protein